MNEKHEISMEGRRALALIEAKKRLEDIEVCRERYEANKVEQKKRWLETLIRNANERIAMALALGKDTFQLSVYECESLGLKPEAIIKMLNGSDYTFEYIKTHWLSWEYWNTAIGSEMYRFKIIKKEN